jgi:hypothetical protein
MNINYNATTRYIGSIPFMLIWVVGHLVSWGAFYFMAEQVPFSDMTFLVLSGVILGGGLGFFQKLLLRYAYGIPLNGWLRVTILGWLGGWFSYYIGVQTLPNLFYYPFWLLLIPMFGIPAVLQWLLLRQHVKSASLWVAAATVSAMTFSMVFDNSTYGLDSHLLSASAQGAVTGLTMLWLFGMTQALPQSRQRNVSRLSSEYYDYAADENEIYEEAPYEAGRFIQG